MIATVKPLCPQCRHTDDEEYDDLPVPAPDEQDTGDVSGESKDGESSTKSQQDDTPEVEGGSTGKSAGDGAGSGLTEEQKDKLKQAAQNFLDEMHQNEAIRQEIQQAHTTIRDHKSEPTLPDANRCLERRTPTNQGSALRRRFVEEMGRLNDQADPGWDFRRDSGRVNIPRYVRSRNADEAFDLWRDGAGDACDIEAVIALDVSGSMGIVAEQTAEAMWIIKSGLDIVGASTTVITYDGRSEILYRADEKAAPNSYKYNFLGGGTNPGPALKEACFILADSRRTSKILISITDGAWSYYHDPMVQALTDSGVHTSMLFYNSEDAGEYGAIGEAHGHKTYVEVSAPTDIVKFARTLVTDIIRERL